MIGFVKKITTRDGRELSGIDEIRYRAIFIIRSTKFRCSVDQAKTFIFRAANGIFAKVCRLAPEEVILELLKCKCLPVWNRGLCAG